MQAMARQMMAGALARRDAFPIRIALLPSRQKRKQTLQMSRAARLRLAFIPRGARQVGMIRTAASGCQAHPVRAGLPGPRAGTERHGPRRRCNQLPSEPHASLHGRITADRSRRSADRERPWIHLSPEASDGEGARAHGRRPVQLGQARVRGSIARSYPSFMAVPPAGRFLVFVARRTGMTRAV